MTAAPSARQAPPVPLVLVRLKLRLLRNRAGANKVGTALAAVGALVFGLFGFAGVAASAAARDPRASRAVLVLGASALLIGWTLLPLVTFGTDETLDPGRLVLLPLRRKPLMQGLLVCSLVGFGPVAVAIALAGAVVGYGNGAGRLIIVAAVVLLLLLCAASARTTSTALAARLTSRRGRDATIIITALLAVALQGVRFIRFDAFDPALVDRITNVVRWTPPGMLGQAIFDVDRGRLTAATLELLPTLVLIPLLLALWGRVLDRSLTVVTGATDVVSDAKPGTLLPLLPRRLPFITATPWGAVAAKELRYMAREPRRKIQLINSVFLGVVFPLFFSLRQGGSLSPAVVLFASLAGYVTVLSAMNQFGFDGGALWVDVAAGPVVHSELVGKNVATLVIVAPAVSVAAVILAAFSGGWPYVPVALALGVAGVGVGLSVANVTSVRFPQRLPDRSSPLSGRGTGTGCVTGLAILAAMVVQGALLTPVVIAATLAVLFLPVALVVVAPAGVLYAYLLWRVGLRVATQDGNLRQPELILAVNPLKG